MVGDSVVMVQTAAMPLARPRVIAASVVVHNWSRTQVYVEGLDYVLTLVGLTTRIQRLLGGNILAGQTVLVDYDYELGGTYSASEFNQNLNLEWAVTPFVNLYTRFNSVTPHLTSGTPTSALNTVRRVVYGARAEMPVGFATDLIVGGWYEHEDLRETRAPLARDEGEIHLQGELQGAVGLNYRLGARSARVTADNAFLDNNRTGYDLLAGWRHSSGVACSPQGCMNATPAGTGRVNSSGGPCKRCGNTDG